MQSILLRYTVFFAMVMTWTVTPSHQQMEITITIDVTNVTRSDIYVTIPQVCTVLLRGLGTCTVDEVNCTIPAPVDGVSTLSMSNNQTCVCQNSNISNAEDKRFYLGIDPKLTSGCQNYIFNRSFDEDLSFTCNPFVIDRAVNSGGCPSMSNLSRSTYHIAWYKFFSQSQLTDFMNTTNSLPQNGMNGSQLNTGTYNPPVEVTRNGNTRSSSIAITTSDSVDRVTNDTLQITGAGWESAGFYLPVLFNGTDVVTLQLFTVYVSLSILETRDDRNFSRVLGNRFTAFQCRVLSFPPPSVSWTTVRQGQTFDNPMVLREDDRINFETINSDYPWGVVPNGQIVFSNVEYSDSLVYRCTATNEASGQMGTWTRILRVRDPLRPLWPVLGFIAVLLLVAVIVLIGHLVERWQDQRKNAKSESLSASDSGRNCSVASNSDGDSPTSDRYPGHSAVRRVSSAKQVLLQESTNL